MTAASDDQEELMTNWHAISDCSASPTVEDTHVSSHVVRLGEHSEESP